MDTSLKPSTQRPPALRLIAVVTGEHRPLSGKKEGQNPPQTRRKAPSRQSRAKRSLLGGMLLVALLHLGLAGLLETACPHWRDPEFGHRLHQLRRLQQQAAASRPLVLILGTSRAQNGLQPSAMLLGDGSSSPLVFNYALTGSPPLKVLLTLHRLLDCGIVPDAILVELLPLWLASDAPAEVVFAPTAERLSWSDLHHLRPYCADFDLLYWHWWKLRLTPWSTQRVILKSHWCPRWLPWNERVDPFWTGMTADGFMPFLYAEPTPEFRQRTCEHARREYAYAFGGITFGERSIQAMEELVAICRQRGIALAWFEPPTSPRFRSWFAAGVWERGQQDMLALAQQWNIPVFLSTLEMREEEFADGHHLLRAGAARYSQWLAEQHVRPWLTSSGLISSPPSESKSRAKP